MQFIGAHVSASGGVENAPLNARDIGARALFTRNQRQWNAKPLTEESITAFRRNMDECGYGPRHVLPHDSYLINIGSPNDETRTKSMAALEDEVVRAGQLGLAGVNFHPGAHLNQMDDRDRVGVCIDTCHVFAAG